jgi:hypothetical protein
MDFIPSSEKVKLQKELPEKCGAIRPSSNASPGCLGSSRRKVGKANSAVFLSKDQQIKNYC